MRLNDMAPASTINNSANVSALQSEIVGYGLGRFAILGTLTYFANKIIGEYRKWMAFALSLSVRFHIFDISIVRIPSQVFETVITSVSVAVTSLCSKWARANESRKDQTVDVYGALLSEGVNKNHDLPTILVIGTWLESAPSICISPLILVARQDVPIWMSAVTRKIRDRLTVRGQKWNGFVHAINYITQGPMVQTCVI